MGVGSGVWGLGFGVEGLGSGVWGLGLGVRGLGLGFRVQGSGTRVEGSGIKVQSVGTRIWGHYQLAHVPAHHVHTNAPVLLTAVESEGFDRLAFQKNKCEQSF